MVKAARAVSYDQRDRDFFEKIAESQLHRLKTLLEREEPGSQFVARLYAIEIVHLYRSAGRIK